MGDGWGDESEEVDRLRKQGTERTRQGRHWKTLSVACSCSLNPHSGTHDGYDSQIVESMLACMNNETCKA